MLPVHPEKQESEQEQDDHPDPAVAALFCGVGGLKPRGRVRNRQRLVHVFFFSNVSFQNIRIVSNIFSYAKWNVETTIHRPVMRCARSLKTRAMDGIALGFRAECLGRSVIFHNSPYLARAWYFMDETTP
jgi:hypothetical protein